MQKYSVILVLFLSFNLFSQTNWYVDYQNGSDSNNGTSFATAKQTVNYLTSNNLIQPGDTVFIIGEYHNPSYNPNFTYGGNNDRNNPHIWHKENTIKLNNLHGSENNYIIFKPYDSNTVLKGDGANILRISNSSYIKVQGFEIYGEVDNIPISTAEGLLTDGLQFLYLADNVVDENHPTLSEVLYRVTVGTTIQQIENTTYSDLGGSAIRPSYPDTRGFYISGCHHMEMTNNTIHHTPGGGLRVSESSFVKVLENEIYNCSGRSYSGTHALVITKAKEDNANASDDPTYSIVVAKNTVRDNFNEVFSWSPQKTIITPRIDEGKGISLQRNNLNPWENGNMRILVENNLCYWNGFSGVHSNDGWHIDFINNTCYMNSYTNTVTYADDQSGKNIGISTSGGDDIKIINNISTIDIDWDGFAIAANETSNLTVSDNLIFGINGTLTEDDDVTAIEVNTTIANPFFIDATMFDFGLQPNSPAISLANTTYAPTDDYYGFSRDANPDLGAIEYGTTVGISDFNSNKVNVYPNPVNNILQIDGTITEIENVTLYDVLGKKISMAVNKTDNSMDLSNLKTGVYFLKTNNQTIKILKL